MGNIITKGLLSRTKIAVLLVLALCLAFTSPQAKAGTLTNNKTAETCNQELRQLGKKKFVTEYLGKKAKLAKQSRKAKSKLVKKALKKCRATKQTSTSTSSDSQTSSTSDLSTDSTATANSSDDSNQSAPSNSDSIYTSDQLCTTESFYYEGAKASHGCIISIQQSAASQYSSLNEALTALSETYDFSLTSITVMANGEDYILRFEGQVTATQFKALAADPSVASIEPNYSYSVN